MTEDALASDRFITIVQVRPPAEWTSPTEPSLEEFGCLGQIFKHERLPDGRFNFLLLGRKRVRLTREITTGKLYRMSEVRVIDDILADPTDDSPRLDLITLFRKFAGDGIDSDLDALFESDLPLGVLTDIMTQALGLPASVKQAFLGEPRVSKRVVDLLDLLRQLGDQPASPSQGSSPFPPPFSLN